MSLLPEMDRLQKRRAILRLVLGQAQVVGATAALVLLIGEGPSVATMCVVAGTGIVTLGSLLLFRVVWRQDQSQRKKGAPETRTPRRRKM